MKLNLALLSLVFLSACSHSVILPGSFQQRPEVAGRSLGGSASIALQKTVAVEIFSDISSNPPTRDDGIDLELIEVVMPALPALDLNFGVLEKLDLYFSSGAGLRWMWMGEPKSEGWKSTIFGGVVSPSETESTSGTAGAETKIQGVEYGLSVGKALNKSALVYLTVGKQSCDAKTTINQTGQIFRYADKFEHQMYTFGLSYGELAYVMLEASLVETKWKTEEAGTDTESNNSWLLGLGLRW